jgi:putative nucleotidyltransferase with HDIG domain
MANDISLEKSIKNILVKRLAAAYALITVLLIILVLIFQLDEIRDLANEQAVESVNRFNAQVMYILDNPTTMNADSLHKELALFRKYRTQHKFGKFIYGSIFNLRGEELAHFSEPNVDIANLQSHLNDFFIEHRITQESDIYNIKFEGFIPYIYVGLPMENSGGELAARAEGVYSISGKGWKIISFRVFRALLIAFLILLLTTVAIYPVISGLIKRLSRLTENLIESNLETLKVLGSAVSKRDSDTDAHNYRVTIIAVKLAKEIGLPDEEIRSIIKGAFLHDVGKIGISDNILLKPGKLTDEEYEIMKSHVSHGVEVIENSDWLEDAKDIVGYHHEKFDGSGYGKGLSGEDIPIRARIFAIADVFDALTSRRPYKEPLTYQETMDILEAGRGSHFDPELLDSFNKISKDMFDTVSLRYDDKLKKELSDLISGYFSREITEKL